MVRSWTGRLLLPICLQAAGDSQECEHGQMETFLSWGEQGVRSVDSRQNGAEYGSLRHSERLLQFLEHDGSIGERIGAPPVVWVLLKATK